MDFVREKFLLLITTPLLAAFIFAEVLITNWQSVRGHGQRRYTWTETLTNGWLALLNGSFDVLMRGVVLVALGYAFTHRIFELQHGWGYWLALLVLEDFAYWALHYVDHRCRFFWAVHVTHHSSEEFNLTTGFRSSVFQPLYRVVYFLPLAWLGFQPLDILFMYAATQIYGVLVHTEWNVRLGWLEHIFVTPSHHRVHHASNGQYLDKNMGMMFIIWDKLFGTFTAEDSADPPRYGLTKAISDRGPLNIVLHEWRDIWRDVQQKGRTLREKLGYVFCRPGWAPAPTAERPVDSAESNPSLSN